MLKLACITRTHFQAASESWSQPETSTTHWTTQFHGAASWFCSLRAPWAGVVNRAKVTVGPHMHVGM